MVKKILLSLLLVGSLFSARHNFIPNPSFEFWDGDTMPWNWQRLTSSTYTTPIKSTIALDGNYAIEITYDSDNSLYRRIYNGLPHCSDTLYVSFYTYGAGDVAVILYSRTYDLDNYYYDIDAQEWVNDYRHKYYSSDGNEWVKHEFTIVPAPDDMADDIRLYFYGVSTGGTAIIDSVWGWVNTPDTVYVSRFGMWHNLFWATNDGRGKNFIEDDPVNDIALALLDTIYWIGLEVGDTQMFYYETSLHSMNTREPYMIKSICSGAVVELDTWKLNRVVRLKKNRYPAMDFGIDINFSSWDTAYDNTWKGNIDRFHLCDKYYYRIPKAFTKALLDYFKSQELEPEIISLYNELTTAWLETECNLSHNVIKQFWLPMVETAYELFPNAYLNTSYTLYPTAIESTTAWLEPYPKIFKSFHYGIPWEYRHQYYTCVMGSPVLETYVYERVPLWEYIMHSFEDTTKQTIKFWDELNHFYSNCEGCGEADTTKMITGEYGHQTLMTANYLQAPYLGFEYAGPNAFMYLTKQGYAINYDGTIMIGYYAYKAMAGAKFTGSTIYSKGIDWLRGVFWEKYRDRDGYYHQWLLNLTPDSVSVPFCWDGVGANITKIAVQPMITGYDPWDSTTIEIPDSVILVPYEINHYWGE